MARQKKQSPGITKEQFDRKFKYMSFQNIFTIIGTSIAILGLLFTYLNYEKSLSRVYLENWAVEIIDPSYPCYSNILFITASIRNLGESSLSLMGTYLGISYTDVISTKTSYPAPISTNITSTKTSYPTPTSTNVTSVNIPTGLFVSPFIEDSSSPFDMICEFARQAEALNSVPNTQSTPEYTLTDMVCLGKDNCWIANNDPSSSLLVFADDKQNIINRLVSKKITVDDKPIRLMPGEAKLIFIAWYIPHNFDKKVIPVQLDVTIIFNNDQSIKFDVMDKFSGIQQ